MAGSSSLTRSARSALAYTSGVAVAISQPHRYSPSEYRRLVAAGVFDEARVELIDGLIADMSPKTRAHEKAIAWLNQRLVAAVDPGLLTVRIAAPLSIGRSEPEPDVAVIAAGTPEPHHPSSAALVIEVAVSSLARDLHDKPPVYAGAGVGEYWVIDLDAGRAVCHRNPQQRAYTDITEIPAPGSLELASVGLTLELADLLAAAAR